jgi:hypothetical protein
MLRASARIFATACRSSSGVRRLVLPQSATTPFAVRCFSEAAYTPGIGKGKTSTGYVRLQMKEKQTMVFICI